MFGIIKLTIHTITGMWVSIVLFKLMTNGWSGFYFQCCVLSLVYTDIKVVSFNMKKTLKLSTSSDRPT